jgi:glycosyltransferase involved in cell wall biosynthesis
MASPEPTVTAVIAAYNAERWIAETLDAILGQTRTPDQVVVVDDGSTDRTAEVLATFGDRITVVTRVNGGCPAAFNTAFAYATSDFVAMCGADDIWGPRKLEWQMETIRRHPQVDVLFGDAEIFGLVDETGTYARPTGEGVLDSKQLIHDLYAENLICAPSIVIRRSLFERLGNFVEAFGADDYEYWMRALRDGATFFYDPRILLRYRRHENNLSSELLWMGRCSHDVHRWYADLPEDRRYVRDILAYDRHKIGRWLVDEGQVSEARAAFRASLRIKLDPRAAAWVAILSLPTRSQRVTGDAFVRLSRALEAR